MTYFFRATKPTWPNSLSVIDDSEVIYQFDNTFEYDLMLNKKNEIKEDAPKNTGEPEGMEKPKKEENKNEITIKPNDNKVAEFDATLGLLKIYKSSKWQISGGYEFEINADSSLFPNTITLRVLCNDRLITIKTLSLWSACDGSTTTEESFTSNIVHISLKTDVITVQENDQIRLEINAAHPLKIIGINNNNCYFQGREIL